jgi:hypothetical protein
MLECCPERELSAVLLLGSLPKIEMLHLSKFARNSGGLVSLRLTKLDRV